MGFDSLLNRTCTIQRNTPTQDNFGDAIDAWANIATSVKCRLQKNKSYSKSRDELGDYLDKQFTVYMKASESVQVHDRLLIDGVYYTVLGANKDSEQHHFELQCELIED